MHGLRFKVYKTRIQGGEFHRANVFVALAVVKHINLVVFAKKRVCVKACGFDKNSTDFEVGKIEVVRKI